MQQYYDKLNNRLVYIEKKASVDYWDDHWNVGNFKSIVDGSKNNQFILINTQRYLKMEKFWRVVAGWAEMFIVYIIMATLLMG